jgi:preprotein translocase SecE subunit
LKECWGEVAPPHGKVSWPDRKTVIASTGIVFITVALVSIYLGIVDLIVQAILGVVFKR